MNCIAQAKIAVDRIYGSCHYLFMNNSRVDYFFQQNWRRINATFKAETIERHEAALMSALCNRRAKTIAEDK